MVLRLLSFRGRNPQVSEIDLSKVRWHSEEYTRGYNPQKPTFLPKDLQEAKTPLDSPARCLAADCVSDRLSTAARDSAHPNSDVRERLFLRALHTPTLHET